MRTKPVRAGTCALEIRISWSDGTPLQHAQLSPPRPFFLRDRLLGTPDCEFAVDRAWIGARDHELVSVRKDRVVVHGLAGDVRLHKGESTTHTIGPLQFQVRLSDACATPLGIFRRRFDLSAHGWTAGSLAVHLLALACMAWMPPKASSLSLDALNQDLRYARYLTTPITREPPEEWGAGVNSQPNQGGEQPRASGEEGRAGETDAPAKRRRLGVAGDAKKRSLSRLPAERRGSQGILGVLARASSQLAMSSAFDGAQSLGYDPVDALGQLFGDRLGESSGFHGLALRSTGRSGGGLAKGTVGVGSLDTGTGARAAPGLGHSARSEHRARVPRAIGHEAEVRGSLSKEIIRRVVQRNLAQVRFCYERALVTRPELRGRVAVQFLIGPSGAVSQSRVGASSLKSSQLETCIAQAVRRWSFPAPDGGGYVSVSYPFLLEHADD